ncbi:methionyl-tRNA formyltransferase [Exiguobacterium sp. KRL4]|uniref:methionyl-tRNA formyltransferase n=1 Tax=Exiguobacterium sp. KRL4 TaxID=1914536 RepID=UPI0009F37C78|nr:methionyl-tRNA formyltransferase [Exiguobacterium sp. KRL4]
MYKVVEVPNDVLRQQCQRVTKFDKKLGKMIDRMFDTMYEYDGVGLAAPQINQPIRVAVVHTDDETGPVELINPEIIEASGSEIDDEGCLSMPGIFGPVERFEQIVVKSQDRLGRNVKIKANGFFARAIQHEMDHLDGILFTDKLVEKPRVVFMGTPEFAANTLREVIDAGYDVVGVVSQPDKPVGRKREIKPTPVKEVALAHDIPVLQPIKIREDYQALLDLKPDLIITAAYGQIVPTVVLEAPRFGAINVHASLLPKYRGGAPIHQAIIDGETETGVTIMYMVDRLDAGDMLSKIIVPIEERDTVGTMFDKLSAAGARLLIETLPQLIAGTLTPEAQQEEDVTFSPNISRERERLDFSRSGEDLYNQIRGMNPFPSAYTTLGTDRLKVYFAEKVPGTGTPGEIIALEADGPVIATGSEIALKLTDLQPAGKKRMDGTTFMRGVGQTLTIGQKVGEQA